MPNDKCIIIPCHNEEKNIILVINNIRRYSDADIIVIDDGSQDGTSSVAKAAGVFVIRHPFNMGYGVALQTGYKYAVENKYDILVQIDGDGQHSAKFIPELFSQVENSVCDVAIGSRFLAESQYQVGFMKSTGIKLFRRIIWLITGEHITDPTSGYQCLNSKALKFFTNDRFPTDYPDANVIIMLHRAGFKIREIGVKMMPNPDGQSMHRGILTISYYLFKMFLSILVTLIRKN